MVNVQEEVVVAGAGVILFWITIWIAHAFGCDTRRGSRLSCIKTLSWNQAVFWSAVGVWILIVFLLTLNAGVGDGHKVVSSDKSKYILPFVLGRLAKLLFALAWLPVIRYPGIDSYVARGVPFERRVRFHRLCAVAFIAVVTIHGVWMLFATEFEYLGIGQVSLPGLVSLVLFLVVAAGAHPWVRRNYFNVFYTLHSLLILASVFSVVHIPSIALYLLVPAGMWFLFFVARHIRAYRARQIASCTLLTTGTTAAVAMSFVWPETWADPRPGSYAFLCVPSLSYFQWHPFSIATFSNENRLAQLIIKPTGANEWTGRLASLAVDGDVAVPVWIDGPYGSLPDLSKFKVILLCAGGVGVTPMISLLQWLARAASSHNHTDGSFCLKNIVFLWTARDLETVSNLWFGEVFQSNELRDLRRVCDVSFVFHNTSLPSSALNGKKEEEEEEEQSATTSSTSNSLMTTSSTTPTASSSPSSSSSSSSTPHLPSSTFPLSSGPGPITTAWAPASGRPDLNRFFSSIDELVTCPSNVFVAVCGPTKFADEVTALAATRSFLLHRETFAL